MKIDVTSMFFNSSIDGQTATPAWGTSVGQNKSKECRIDDFKPGVVDMIIGMSYKAIADPENVDASKGSSKRDILQSSVFNTIYINNIKVDKAQYVLLLVREHSKSHEGRLLISYAPYISYNGIANEECVAKMQELLGCTSKGCWFVYDISIKNQSDLYFSAVVVNSKHQMAYNSKTSSQSRSDEWKSLIPPETEGETGNGDRQPNDLLGEPLQQIFYGAPGTGKSFKTDRTTAKYSDTIRTTFHPDSDYSTFVGAYKPTMEMLGIFNETGDPITMNGAKLKKEQITYKFVKQAFLKAYVKAWQKYACALNPKNVEPQILVIEEINRGNCAQIFGDLFQLLDRKDGFSTYPIEADADLAKCLLEEETKDNPSFGKEGLSLDGWQANAVYRTFKDTKDDIVKKICKGEVLVLPPNLYIWATMNTSDQSLFPIDSAFKRRWDWKYMRITNHTEMAWRIKFDYLDNGEVQHEDKDWWEFLYSINKHIKHATHSEDKQLGYFFCKANNDKAITAETFVGKVIFYLWNDVFKTSGYKKTVFKDMDFDKFYLDNAESTEDNPDGLNKLLVHQFIENVIETAKEL